MSVFLERLSMWNMLSCAEQVQLQKYKTHAYMTPNTACVQTIIPKHPTHHVSKQSYPNIQHTMCPNNHTQTSNTPCVQTIMLKHPTQHVSKQSYPNIQLSSKDVYKKTNVPMKHKYCINVRTNNPNHTNYSHQTLFWLCKWEWDFVCWLVA